MMREIKFRAIHKLTKHWFEDIHIIYQDGEWFEDYRALEDGRPMNLDQVAIMQYTGLKDKNGKEIYVGDIVQGGILRMTSGVEMYNSRTTVHFKGGMFKCGQSSLNSFNDRTEVVGNIYENPELLGGNQ